MYNFKVTRYSKKKKKINNNKIGLAVKAII